MALSLGGDQVEGILRLVDTLECVSGPDRSDDGQLNIQCFGVFQLPHTPRSQATPSEVEDHPSARSDTTEQDRPSEDDSQANTTTTAFEGEAMVVAPSTEHLSPPRYSSEQAARDLYFLRASATTASRAAVDTIQDTTSPGPLESITSLSGQHVLPSITATIPAIPQEHSLCIEDRFLLHYYVHNVVRLFCVIDTKKSPWRTLHIARVLQSMGESDVYGSTSRILVALRSCLLATSAFCLSNSHGSAASKNDESKWATIASEHRCKAIEILQQAMKIDLDSQLRPKYKDFLATMLSMITIDVKCRTRSPTVYIDTDNSDFRSCLAIQAVLVSIFVAQVSSSDI